MATNKTSFLNMNDWVGTDPFKREEINDNFRTLDEKSKEHEDKIGEVTTQLAEKATKDEVIVKADKSYVDSEIAKKASGAPKGVYATLTALQTALPTGSPDNQLVTADGKWYYWNGTTWTAGAVYQATQLIEDDVYNLMGLPNPEPNVQMTNLVTNGDFASATGWTGTNATISVASNKATVTGNGGGAVPRIQQTKPITTGRKYFLKAKMKATNASCTKLKLSWYNNVTAQLIQEIANPVMDTVYDLSGVITATNTSASAIFFLEHYYADAATANGKVMEVQYFSAIDITDILAADSKIDTTMLINSIAALPNGYVNGTQPVPLKNYSNNKLLAQVNGVVKMASLDELDNSFVTVEVPNVQMTNLMTNGIFADTTSWTGTNATFSVANNKATVTGNGANLAPRLQQTRAMTSGRKYLARAKVKVTNANCSAIKLEWYATATQTIATINSPVQNTEYVLSGIITGTATSSGAILWINNIYADATSANGKVMEVQYVSLIDITDLLASDSDLTETMLIEGVAALLNGYVSGTQSVPLGSYNNNKVFAQVNGVVKMTKADELITTSASQIVINDAGNKIVANNVEDALQEMAAKVDSIANLNGANIRPVIIDTDFWTDPDDSLAIRIALWAERHGMIDIVGICLDAIATNSVKWLDGFLNFEGRPGLCIGADQQATDYPGSPTMTNTWRSDYTSNTQAEDCVQFYRRALTSVTGKVDIFGLGMCNALSRLLQSPPDAYSPLTGVELVNQKVNHLWLMGGKYPSGSEHNFNLNTRARTSAKYVCDNWPTEITFLGWEVSNTVKIASTLDDIYDASDLMVDALTRYGAFTNGGKEAWDPMLTLLACYNNFDVAGYDVVRGTNTVDEATGANTFVTSPTGKHKYVVKRYGDKWYVRAMDSIVEKNAWLTRPLGAQQLSKP